MLHQPYPLIPPTGRVAQAQVTCDRSERCRWRQLELDSRNDCHLGRPGQGRPLTAHWATKGETTAVYSKSMCLQVRVDTSHCKANEDCEINTEFSLHTADCLCGHVRL